MFGLSYVKLAIGAVVALAVMYSYYATYNAGRNAERTATLQNSVEALRERNLTDDKIRGLDDNGLCRALGGRVSDNGDCE